MADNRNDKMSRDAAGRRSDEAHSPNHDKDFYQEIGRRRGRAASDRYDSELFPEIDNEDEESRRGD
ncbi:hypothetical protein SAMN04487895_109253 [Paenibacillus sophorae]|uniref:Stress-induced protein, KGG, repeat-containing protein n=1 Tax=Paenibacillus sophorae TaxID=1333845 RepID=A0A1H8RD46_9BACL|nr:hypothetical protein [Paenibacillus sophorae]QWU15045.1 stress-induced protein, KGG, repeat-containing protein [Paenibacillus sophorae]SEO64272.1 hypothetical protein SAMN04487895_109253 [Paenibacillus sophorae]